MERIAKETKTDQEAKADSSVEEGKLSAKPVDEDEYSLDELLAGVKKSNLHAEIDTGSATGREVWDN